MLGRERGRRRCEDTVRFGVPMAPIWSQGSPCAAEPFMAPAAVPVRGGAVGTQTPVSSGRTLLGWLLSGVGTLWQRGITHNLWGTQYEPGHSLEGGMETTNPSAVPQSQAAISCPEGSFHRGCARPSWVLEAAGPSQCQARAGLGLLGPKEG